MTTEFPTNRLRRLRYNNQIRKLVEETSLSVNDLVLPLFVCPGSGIRQPILSMPGNYRLSIDELVLECKKAKEKGIYSFLLFGIPESKDEEGIVAQSDEGIVQLATKALKKEISDILIIADVCHCEYTTHGHCGTIIDGDVDNDSPVANLAIQAVSLAKAGADMIAPSDMMDGRVKMIRKALDENGYYKIPIMSYSAKFKSSFYGPFREAADSAPSFGDRSTYQMNYKNANEALREVESDINEGADIVMVKPALAFLDIIAKVKANFNIPIAAYNVSGEFAMVKAAGANNWIDERNVMVEILHSIKRAGADIIITYHAMEMADILNSNN